jgi:hypothetical protein
MLSKRRNPCLPIPCSLVSTGDFHFVSFACFVVPPLSPRLSTLPVIQSKHQRMPLATYGEHPYSEH